MNSLKKLLNQAQNPEKKEGGDTKKKNKPKEKPNELPGKFLVDAAGIGHYSGGAAKKQEEDAQAKKIEGLTQ